MSFSCRTPIVIYEDGTAQFSSDCDTTQCPSENDAPGSVIATRAELASVIDSLDLDARVILNTSGRPPDILDGVGNSISGVPTASFMRQNSGTLSFRFSRDGISCEGYYNFNGDVVVSNLGDRSLEFFRLDGNDENDSHSIDYKQHISLGVGSWRINPLDLDPIDMHIFAKHYRLTVRHLKRQQSGSPSGRPKKCPRTQECIPQSSTRPSLMTTGTIVASGNSSEGSPVSSGPLTLLDQFLVRGDVLTVAPHFAAPRPIRGRRSESYTLSDIMEPGIQTGLASVFKGSHSIHGIVTIKTWAPKSKDSTPCLAQMWKRERFSLSQLKHPSIVEFKGSDARLWTIYTEYAYPELLHRRDKKNHFTGTLEDGRNLSLSVASALLYLHVTAKMTHGNIAPQHVLRRNGRFLLSGFGFDSSAHDMQLYRDGGYFYTPPEHLYLEDSGLKGDMYSLGMVLLYVWKYIPLPEGKLEKASFRQWVTRIRKKRSMLQDKTESQILKSLLEISPDDRFSAHDLIMAVTESFPQEAARSLQQAVRCSN